MARLAPARIAGGCCLCLVVQLAWADGAAECTRIKAPDARLACFDQAFDGTAGTDVAVAAPTAADRPGAGSGETGAAPVGGARDSVPVIDEAGFGLEKSKDELEGESLTSTIADVDQDAYGRAVIGLTNGQVWRQVEDKRFVVRPGETAEIRHAAFGSYRLRAGDNQVWTRVRRVQ